jgi:subtilisin-like proprotein convertase family protein
MTWLKPKMHRRAMTIACLLTLLMLQLPTFVSVSAQTSKEASQARLNELRVQINSLQKQVSADPTNKPLRKSLNAATTEYNSISASLGGDQGFELDTNPAETGDVADLAPPVPANCAGTTTTYSNTTPVAIPTSGTPTVTSTIAVAGAGTFLWDVDVLTNLTHTFNADVDMTITSPAGTVVTLTTDNGSSFDNVFNGTVWDDDADPGGQVPYTSNNGVVSDRTTYADNTLASPLVPEEALGAFIGENPNGTWTLTISDDAGGDGGAITWSITAVHLAAAPAVLLTNAANTTPVAIPTSGTPTVTSTIAVAGATGVIVDLNATTNITHTFNADIDMTITSPAGTVVTLSTDNGSSFDNVFNGTVWDDDADPGGQVPYTSNNGVVSDRTTYADNTLASPLVPEEAMGAFVGENPNGTWTLTISDDAGGDGGAVTWSLAITSGACAAAPVCTLTCPANQVVTATTTTGAVVNYPAPTATNCGPVTCVPPSGSTFPVGTTTVTCTETASSMTTTTTVTYTGPPVAIPDGSATGATTAIAVAGLTGTITDVNFRINGTSCTSNAGDTNAGIDHSWVGDLALTLTSPAATSVVVVDRPGVPASTFGNDGNNYCQSVFDDDGGFPSIENATPAQAPFTGNWSPNNALSAFDGQTANGNWTLFARDFATPDSGSVRSWSLVITTVTVVAGATCSFQVSVNIPWDFCMVNDGPADQAHYIRAVLNPPAASSALRGYYEVRRAGATGVYCGIANQVTYVPGRSLIFNDTDDAHQTLFLNANLALRSGSATHTNQCTFQQTVIRDRNLSDSTCEFATVRPCIVLCP